MVKLPAELSESHKELLRTNKLRTPEEAAAAAAAALQKASEALSTNQEPSADSAKS